MLRRLQTNSWVMGLCGVTTEWPPSLTVTMWPVVNIEILIIAALTSKQMDLLQYWLEYIITSWWLIVMMSYQILVISFSNKILWKIQMICWFTAEPQCKTVFSSSNSNFSSFTATLTTDASVDLLISDQLPGPSTSVSAELDLQDLSRTRSRPAPTQQSTDPSTTSPRTTTTTKPAPTTIKPTTKLTTSTPPKIAKLTTTELRTTFQQTTTTIQPTMHVNQHTTSASDTNVGPPIDASPTADSQPGPKSRLSWTESPADQPKPTKKPGRDTYNTVLCSAHVLVFSSLISVSLDSQCDLWCVCSCSSV